MRRTAILCLSFLASALTLTTETHATTILAENTTDVTLTSAAVSLLSIFPFLQPERRNS